MLSRSGWRSLNSLERQCLREQMLRTQKCVRCFHASMRQRAEESNSASAGNDQGTPVNTPKKGRKRQQRAAELSEDIQKLAQSGPSRPTAAPQDDTPLQTTTPNVMGDNVSAEKGGIAAQGVDVPPTTRRAQEQEDQGKDVPRQKGPPIVMEEPLDGGESIVPRAAILSEPVVEQNDQSANGTATSTPASEPQTPTKADTPRDSRIGKQDLLGGRHNPGSIFGGNFIGAIAKHLNQCVVRDTADLESSSILTKLDRGHKRLHAFHSKEALEAAQQEQAKAALERSPTVSSRENPASWKKKGPGLVALSAKTQEKLMRRFVRGEYNGMGLMFGKEEHAVAAVNTINRQLNKNPTFSSRDGQRLREKVISLLPTPKAPAAPRTAQAKA